MKRIGISQNVEIEISHGVRRDCLDQAWTQLFSQVGLDFVPIPNTLENVERWVKHQQLDGILLSGGNDLAFLSNPSRPAPERDVSEVALLRWAESVQLPVLGICRGMQMINSYLGGSLTYVNGHVATTHSVRSMSNKYFFKNYSIVNSFHNWGIKISDLAPTLEVLLLADDETVEAFQHRSLPWFGIMWHPERENGAAFQQDIAIIRSIFSD